MLYSGARSHRGTEASSLDAVFAWSSVGATVERKTGIKGNDVGHDKEQGGHFNAVEVHAYEYD